MKRVLYIFTISLILWGCEGFLDTEDYTRKTTGNFPQTVQDANQMIAGLYASMPDNKGMDDNPMENSWIVSMVIGDNCFGGASTSGIFPQGLNKFMKFGSNMFSNRWRQMYRTIFRANMLLETLNLVEDWSSEEQKNQYFGEAYFVRAWAYLDLCQMFGTVPLITSTSPVNLPRAEAKELFGQIASDLIQATELMSDAPFGASDAPTLGHATKWASEALLARAFLFYTGYYQQESMPLSDGGELSKNEVINLLDDCIKNSGHALIDDYRELWPYSNEFTAPDYKYAADNNLQWIGEEGANTETVLPLNLATWPTSITTTTSPTTLLYTSAHAALTTPKHFHLGKVGGMPP